MSEELLIRHCSPTLAGMKTGSMFTSAIDSETQLLRDVQAFNRRLREKGVRIVPLRVRDDRALREIDRVLRPDGLLIAPNFVEHKGTLGSRIWSGVLRIAGIRFAHQWSAPEYLRFLEACGWEVVFSKEMAARIAMLYTECVRTVERL